MGIKNTFWKRRFLSRIYLLVMSAVVLMTVVFSAIVYYNVEKNVLKNENKSNWKVLNQVKYVINYMDRTVTDIGMSAYLDNDVVPIMYGKELENSELMAKINRLKNSLVDTNSFIHSVYVYNNYKKTYYCTLSRAFYRDKYFEELVSSYGGLVPRLRPIFRKVEAVAESGDGKVKYVFSYFIYNLTNDKKDMDGAVILNIQANWLLENITTINSVDMKKGDRVFVLDNNGEFIENNHEENDEFKISFSKVYDEHIKEAISASGRVDNFLIQNINGKRHIIYYTFVEKANWIILKTQPYDEVFEYINRMKSSILIISVIFLVLALAVSISISKGIYKPIGNLVNLVSSSYFKRDDFINSKDEISYLYEIYKFSANQLDKFKIEKNNNKEIMKTYFLRKLLISSYSLTESDFLKAKEENGISLDINQDMAICVIKIDNYKELEQKCSNQDMELYKFAIINITMEVISDQYKNEAIDMKNDQIVVILNPNHPMEAFYENMTGLMKKVQEFVFGYYKISISATIGMQIDSVKKLTKEYNLTLNSSMYRYVYGKMSIITPDVIKQNMENIQIDYPHALEMKFIEEIKGGNIKSIEEVLTKILAEISKLSYSNIILSVMHLIKIIKDSAEDMNLVRLEPVYLDFNILSQSILELETIEELFEKVMSSLKQIVNKEQSTDNDRHIILVEAMKDMINYKYFDDGLCIQQIADMLKMSTDYIGKVFKRYTQATVSEYINEVRLKKATEMLLNTNFKVSEIAQKVGLESESYFYRLFKRKYGTTPKEYSLKNAMKNG